MSKVTLTIELDAYCSHVPDHELDAHLEGIAFDIGQYAKDAQYHDWHRKVQIDYETQEDVNLSISTNTRTE